MRLHFQIKQKIRDFSIFAMSQWATFFLNMSFYVFSKKCKILV